jgi:hypothetical protein
MTANSRTFKKVLSDSQIRSLNLPIGSKVSLEFTAQHLEGFQACLGKESGHLTTTSDGYTLKIDSDDEEIIEAYKYLQERVDEGCWVRFALHGDKPTFYVWQSSDWKYNANGILTISLN